MAPEWTIEQCVDDESAWTVEFIGTDGEIYQSIFADPDAETRAREYAEWKYASKTEERLGAW